MSQPHLLPGPTADLWDWQLQGACRGENSDVFYHPDGERGRARAQRENRAKAICNSCPVIDLCREHALQSAEPYGKQPHVVFRAWVNDGLPIFDF